MSVLLVLAQMVEHVQMESTHSHALVPQDGRGILVKKVSYQNFLISNKVRISSRLLVYTGVPPRIVGKKSTYLSL